MTAADVRAVVHVPVDPHRAFELFTEGIGQWWRDYWNDERATGIRFEEAGGGRRLVEVWGEEGLFEIGRVTGWRPGEQVAFTWCQVDWPAGESTEVSVAFGPADGGTEVTLDHRGWAALSDPSAGDGYQSGWEELLGWYAEVARR